MKAIKPLLALAAAATMSLSARAGLPAGYTELEYVDSDGTQHLDTGFKPDATSAIKFDFTLIQNENSKAIFATSWANYSWLAQIHQGKFIWWGYNGNQVGAISADVRYFITVDSGVVALLNRETGAIVASAANMSLNNAYNNLYFFGDGFGSGRNAKVRFYGARITQNGATARRFVPAKRDSDGKPGLYDIAGTYADPADGFYVEAAGNALSAGPEIATPATGAQESVLLVSGYAGTEPLENFQTLVKLTGSNYGFRFSQCAADGSDIYFTDSDGNVIPHEIDSWDNLGDSFIWVRLPEVKPVAATQTTWFKMHWGAAPTAEQIAASSQNVWTDGTVKAGNFVGVWHMNESGSASEPDATGNNFSGVPQAPNAGNDTSTMTTTAGIVGTSRINLAAKGNCMKASFDKNKISDYSKHTITGWWTSDAYNYYDRFISYGEGTAGVWQADFYANGSYGYHGLWDGPFASKFDFGSACTSFKFPNWVYLTIVFNGTTGQIYANGVLVKNVTGLTAKARPTAEPFLMIGAWAGTGTGNWNGKYDEVRLYDGAQTALRVKADYDTMKTPETFVTLGTSKTLLTASWTGEAGDGDVSNPQNWIGVTLYDQTLHGVPSEATTVTIESSALFIEATTENPLVFNSLSIGNCVLAADCDLSGIGADLSKVSIGTIDLNGNKLTLAGLNATAGTITDNSSGDPGELVLNVASGTAQNTKVAITGNLKFTKGGAGIYNASKASQTYSGGTEITSGTVMFNTSGNNQPLGARNGTVTVSAGGKLQFQGHYVAVPLNVYKYVLNGGTLENVVADVWGGDVQMTDVELTADSYLVASMNFGILNGTNPVNLNMNGHKLTVTANNKWFMLGNAQITGGGEIEINGDTGMYLYRGTSSGIDARGTTMTFKGTALLDWPLLVTDYTAVYTGTGRQAGTGGSLNVYGIFKPTVDRFMGCTMQDGSTIDLSAWNAETLGWPCYSHADIGGSQGTRPLKFANGTVTIDMSGVADVKALATAKTYLFRWDNYVTRNTSTTFVLDAATDAKGYQLKADDTGIQICPRPGFTIRIAGQDVIVPLDWVETYVDGADCESDPAAIKSALENTVGANGLPLWQSWCLGLVPTDASSVVLCEAAEAAPAAGAEVSIKVKNLEVPEALGSGVSVMAYLDRKSGATDWTPVGEGVRVSSGDGITLNGALAGTGCNFFRVRIKIQ